MSDQLQYLVNSSLVGVFVTVGAGMVFSDSTVAFQLPTTVVEIFSWGKKLIFRLQNETCLVFSFAMTGRLLKEEADHTKCTFRFELQHPVVHHAELYYDDVRFLGKIALLSQREATDIIQSMGPSLLDIEITDYWLWMITPKRDRRKCLIDLLIDQKFIAGIGWYLSNEILHYCRIHPLTRCDGISILQWKLLRVVSYYVI